MIQSLTVQRSRMNDSAERESPVDQVIPTLAPRDDSSSSSGKQTDLAELRSRPHLDQPEWAIGWHILDCSILIFKSRDFWWLA